MLKSLMFVCHDSSCRFDPISSSQSRLVKSVAMKSNIWRMGFLWHVMNVPFLYVDHAMSMKEKKAHNLVPSARIDINATKV
jgi:hypothetical protein